MPPQLSPPTTTIQKLCTSIPTSLLAYLPAIEDVEHAPSSRPDFLPIRIHIGVFSSHAPRYADCSAWVHFSQPTTPSHRNGGASAIVVYVHDEMRNKWDGEAVNLAAEMEWIELDREFWACENAKDVRTMARWYLLNLNYEPGNQDTTGLEDVPWSKEFEGDLCKLCTMFCRKKPEMDKLKTFRAPNVGDRGSSVECEAGINASSSRRFERRDRTPLQTKVDAPSARLRIRTSGPSDEQFTMPSDISSPEMIYTDTTDSDSGSSSRISVDPTIHDQRMLNLTAAIEQHHNVLIDIRRNKNHLEGKTRKEKKVGNGTKVGMVAREILLGMMAERAKVSEEAIKIFEERRKWR